MGKTPLRVNIDETAVCAFQGDCRGNILISKKRPREGAVQRVSRGKRRCYLTHVACVCDRSDLQPLLPQVVIGNESTFLAREFAALLRGRPANVKLVRQQSAWNNDALCASIVRWLGAALRPHAGQLQPILLLDAVRQHTTPRVIKACYAAGIWPIVIPAQMTSHLQPLDTHASLSYKRHLREAYQAARMRSADGNLGVKDLLPCVYAATRRVLQGQHWAAAFDHDGFGVHQGELSQRVRQGLQIDGVVEAGAARPTEDQLRLCFPRRSRVPFGAIWGPYDHPPAPRAASSVPPPVVARAVARRGAAAAPAGGPGAAAPALGRTRAETRLLEALRRGRPLPPGRGTSSGRRLVLL